MKLYTYTNAPNPRRVSLFLAEKGLEIPVVEVNLRIMEHKKPDFLVKNPRAKVPVLELDDGSFISETLAICRYLEALHPEPSLFGDTPKKIGEIEMNNRILEFDFYQPLGVAWRNGPVVKKVYGEMKQIPEAREQAEEQVKAFYERFDAMLKEREYVAGDYFSMADIIALTTIDFATTLVELKPDAGLKHLWAWYERVNQRPAITPLS
ncbi:MAG: glutathione S-transferase family protein [Pseudomonadales bacterium]|nr:glutathione S-transferase family protein [Pseudomonadales bacterium]